MSAPQKSTSPWHGLLSIHRPALDQVLATELFRFNVGPRGTKFLIHKGVVSRLSAPLNALVNGQMSEAAEGCVNFDDVDEDIFVRVSQFAYTGDYTAFEAREIPRPDVAPASSGKGHKDVEVPPSTLPQPVGIIDFSTLEFDAPTITGEFNFDNFLWDREQSHSGTAVAEKKANDKRTSPFKLPYSLVSFKAAVADLINTQCYGVDHRQQKQNRAARATPGTKRKLDQEVCNCPPCSEGSPKKSKQELIDSFLARRLHSRAEYAGVSNNKECFPPTGTHRLESVFLGHARLWVFADRYAIYPLMDVAASKLVRALAGWMIHDSTFIADFGAVARFVYADTMDGTYLRLVLAHFAACVVEDVQGLDGWRLLLNDTPDFAVDLINLMAARFS